MDVFIYLLWFYLFVCLFACVFIHLFIHIIYLEREIDQRLRVAGDVL